MKAYKLNNLIDKICTHNLQKFLLQGLFGIERENVRVDKDGNMSLTPHHDLLGNKEDHPYISTDFSESQVEIITPPLPSIEEVHGFLQTIHDIVCENIGDEYLWPQSAPPALPEEEKIPIAKYSEAQKQHEIYREKLAEIYGKERQLISGLHFNFSLSPRLVSKLADVFQLPRDNKEFREALYLKMTRNFMRYRWFLIWLYGQSPLTHDTFRVKSLITGESQKANCYDGLSVRTSCIGYRNREDFILDYSSIKNFQTSVNKLVASGKLMEDKELYVPLRMKFDEQGELSHLEVRLFDLDPFCKVGVSKNQLHFAHMFMMYCLVKDETTPFDGEEQQKATKNQDIISCYGLDEEIYICDNQDIRARDRAQTILNEMKEMAHRIDLFDKKPYLMAFEQVNQVARHPGRRRVHQLKQEIKEKGFVNFHMEKAISHKARSLEKTYRFYGLEDMELSTQLLLKAAVRRGISFEILDRKENFVKLTKGDKTEYVMQATRTSLEPYSSILMMENKVVTKKVLEEANIRVPGGMEYDTPEPALDDFDHFKGRPIVIKPKTTNFGLGITILKENKRVEHYRRAVEMAFEQDDAILIEEFISGKEFRIFIINDEVVGILHRVPANVKGDGQKTIRELVEQKNTDPLRGKGYRTPLEKIATGEAEEMFLQTQDLTFESVPDKDQVVYLRENSNISTGGDSLDFTDEVHPSYKEISVAAAKALDVKVTGLDMIMEDYTQPATATNHAIIEMNFNPAIHIHCHPYKGKNRYLNEKMLDALGFER